MFWDFAREFRGKALLPRFPHSSTHLRSLKSAWLLKVKLKNNWYYSLCILFFKFHLSVNCPRGHFFNSTGCQACAVDHYQDREAQTSCIPCPSGKSTLGKVASTLPKDCRGNLEVKFYLFNFCFAFSMTEITLTIFKYYLFRQAFIVWKIVHVLNTF